MQGKHGPLGEWFDLAHHDFIWTTHEYRIKPKPLELWVNVYKDGSVYAHQTVELANLDALESSNFVRTVHMIERA